MTPETQILQELVEAIKNLDIPAEAVNRPDWWTIGITSVITIINAAIMVWLGVKQYQLQKQQTKLQERQTKQQEYDIYRRLYPLLYSANYRIDAFLNDMWTAVWQPIYRFEKDFLQNRIKEIDRLIGDIAQNRIDYELQFSKEFFNAKGYIEILSLMSRISHYIDEAIHDGNVHMTEGVHNGSGDYIFDIARHFKNPEMQGLLIQNLQNFIRLKNTNICNDKILDEIREHCKMN